MEKVLGVNVADNFIRTITQNNPFHLTGSIYVTDIIDILIITVFIYSAFLLLKRTRSLLIFLGLAITLALFAFAKLFNLYLTSVALQYFFGVFFIVFVIVFQQEIRKFFELVGLIGTRQIKVRSLTSKSPSTTEALHACVKMAQEKIGALIVLKGEDNLEPFLDNGIELDGIVSEELILSIFDPHSEGHDGAIVINNNRISKFAVQLPLSNNFKEIGKHGTRHSAALGLSESSDALCIVVSEEKGQIAVCYNGRMKSLEQFSDLEKELDKFIKVKYVSSSTGFWQELISQNLGLKSTAVLSAVTLWFFSAYQAGIINMTYTIPVTFINVPEDTLIQSYSPKSVNLTVAGRGEVSFKDVDSGDFAVNIDASSIRNGVNKFNITPADIKQPINLRISGVQPDTLLLTANRYHSVGIDVKVQTRGQPARGYTIRDITVTPLQIAVWIPLNATPPAEIVTEPVDVTGKNESFVTPANLVIPSDIQVAKPGDISANVAITISK
jgi:diadenylate cyclase